MAEVMAAELGDGASASAPAPYGLPLPPGETEASLFAKLVQLLGQRPGGTMLLSDLLSFLPQDAAQSEGSMPELVNMARSWLQGFPTLFILSGDGPRECVTLKIAPLQAPASSPAVACDRWSAQPLEADQGSASSSSSLTTEAAIGLSASRAMEYTTRCALQLRGLPYKAQISDIKAFLGDFSAELQEDGVSIILTKSSQPSGYALVKFKTPETAEKACSRLHKSTMSVAGDGGQVHTRYIEVFSAAEKIDKGGRNKMMQMIAGEDSKPTHGSSLAFQDHGASGMINAQMKATDMRLNLQDQMHQERLINELRTHMGGQPGGVLLLSMLGVALSQDSRSFLKKTNKGLKHFLVQYPQEFRVEGHKGQEKIVYVPTERMEKAMMMDNPAMRSHLPSPYMMGSCPPSMHMAPMQPPMPPFRAEAAMIFDQPQPAMYPVESTPPPPGVPPPPPPPRQTRDPVAPDSPTLRAPTTPTREIKAGTGEHQMTTPSIWGDTPYPSPDVRDRVRLSAAHMIGEMAASPTKVPKGAIDASHSWADPGRPESLGQQWPEWLANTAAGQGPDWMMMNMMMPVGQFNPYAGAFPTPPPFPSTDATFYDELFGAGKMHPTEDSCGSKLGMGDGFTSKLGMKQPPSVLIRGLPLNATTQDVFSLFSKHSVIEGTAEGSDTVRIGGGKKSPWTQAVVEMKSMQEAYEAQKALHGQQLHDRVLDVSVLPSESFDSKVPPFSAPWAAPVPMWNARESMGSNVVSQ
mmetsp:Transcript_6367/g.13911  ORF Transcript_6367/g.13911 Transcript_6367/m.13911 type:complete len:748 (+) Transcript_6367:144-2387(+)